MKKKVTGHITVPHDFVEFNATREEFLLIEQIVMRALKIEKKHYPSRKPHPKHALMMDIEAVHCNGCPLRLKELLAADDLNFAHDVFGIRFHINRDNGQLEDCFLPRFAAPQNASSEN